MKQISDNQLEFSFARAKPKISSSVLSLEQMVFQKRPLIFVSVGNKHVCSCKTLSADDDPNSPGNLVHPDYAEHILRQSKYYRHSRIIGSYGLGGGNRILQVWRYYGRH